VLVQYTEFVPLAVEVIETIYAKKRFDADRAQREAEAVEQTESYLLHGMPREKLENTLRDMFDRADSDGSGRLSRAEFASALRDSGLGLTRQEINVLLSEVDENEDGEIDYREFLPVCFNVLVETVSRQLEEKRVPQQEADLRDFFIAVFQEADAEMMGKLSVSQVRAALQAADIGLSIVQITALLVEARPDEDGLVDYAQFAATAAGIVSTMLEVQLSADKASRVTEEREAGSLSTVAGMDRRQFAEALNSTIGAVDPDARGVADAKDLAEVLMGSMGLNEDEASIVLQLGDLGDGTIDLDYVARFAFDAVVQVAESQAWGASADA
jgi:Ca2+-binding EF-hand superfamily protein